MANKSENEIKDKYDGYSPMMKHYLHTKDKYPDDVLFYRLGDFYEMFFDDAKKVSKLLDLTLTGKECGQAERAPMCGIPYHAADEYIKRLVALGEKVAICEQVQDPSEAKGLVERDVIKIISAGTVTENSMLDERKNNYILCVSSIKGDYGVAWADITTGEFYVKRLKSPSESEVLSLISRISPSEIVAKPDVSERFNKTVQVQRKAVNKFCPYSDWTFGFSRAYKEITTHFGVLNLQSFGIEDEAACVSACGALISYLKETQKHALANINKISLEEDGEYMILDNVAVKNLEILSSLKNGDKFGSLLWVLDKTETSMGSRTLSRWLTTPLQSIDKINYRLNGVSELYSDPLMRNAVRDLLSGIRDTERLSGKISNNNILPKDCLQLSSSLSALPSLKFTLSGANSSILKDISEKIYDFTDLTDLIDHAINSVSTPANMKDGGYIADGFDKELDRLREISSGAVKIIREIEERERESTGIKTLKIGYNKVFGYYIEVTNSFKDKVPYSYIRKQTLTGGERYITEELKKLEEDILTSKDKSIRLENEIYSKIKRVLTDNIKKIQISSRAVAALDAIYSLSAVAKNNNFVRPVIKEQGEPLDIKGGRHPVVEAVLNEPFIPNDAYMNSSTDNMLIITGPNMAGKSTYMRQIALITLMAHVGSFVPAKKAEIPLTDRIFTRVGASDNLIFDQSTFMVEMNEVAAILNKATENSLIVLDEVGRGTSTYDGLSIAWAVVGYVTERIGAKTLFATHYHELSELEGVMKGVKNYKVCVKEADGTIIFLRKIQEGSANRSFGIEVAALAGVPKEVTERAKKILKNLEKKDSALNKLTVQTETATRVLEEGKNEDVINAVKALCADDLTPRGALDFVYRLKDMLKD